MPARSKQLAREFEGVTADIAALIDSCPDARWRQRCVSDERPAGAVAYHVATVNHDFAAIVERLEAGGTYSPSVTMDDVHAQNAEQVQATLTPGKADVLNELRSSSARLARLVRAIDDPSLERIAGTFGGNQLTVQQVVQYVVIGHAREHLETLQQTLAG